MRYGSDWGRSDEPSGHLRGEAIDQAAGFLAEDPGRIATVMDALDRSADGVDRAHRIVGLLPRNVQEAPSYATLYQEHPLATGIT
jgi:hypothetical protein